MALSRNPHSIRLIGPWDIGPEQGERSAHMPSDWPQVVAATAGSSLILRRRFHRPTGLLESTRVFVAMPDAWTVESVRLNGAGLPKVASSQSLLNRFELTEYVRARESHQLEVVLTVDQATQETPFLVALEIEASD